jgi:hypothetical protein
MLTYEWMPNSNLRHFYKKQFFLYIIWSHLASKSEKGLIFFKNYRQDILYDIFQEQVLLALCTETEAKCGLNLNPNRVGNGNDDI